MNYRTKKNIFDKKKPPEANASTQKRQEVKKKPPDANASTQERQTNLKKCQNKAKKNKKGQRHKGHAKDVTAFTTVTMVNAVTPRPFLLQARLPEHEKNKYLNFQKESYVQILIFNTPDSRNKKKH